MRVRGGERGQALVEAVAMLPVCMACALVLVDAGVLVRDRIAVAQATTRAAEAIVVGEDPRVAALDALPAPRRAHAHVRVDNSRSVVVVTIDGGSRIARLAGHQIVLRSSASAPGGT